MELQFAMRLQAQPPAGEFAFVIITYSLIDLAARLIILKQEKLSFDF